LSIAKSLQRYWDARGLYAEARIWIDRARDALKDEAGEPISTSGASAEAWRFFTAHEAHYAARSGNTSKANRHLEDIKTSLAAESDIDARNAELANNSLAKGGIFLSQGKLSDAEKSYREALALALVDIDSSPGVAAAVFHQLGRVAQERGDLAEAMDRYSSALEIFDRINFPQEKAHALHQIAIISHLNADVEKATRLYSEALSIYADVGDRSATAKVYHQQAMLKADQRELAEAEELLRRSLVIKEGIGDPYSIAITYAELGSLASQRETYAAARGWYEKQLEISQRIENEPMIASALSALGRVAEQLGDTARAYDYTYRSVVLTESVGGQLVDAGEIYRVARSLQALGRSEDAEEWLIRASEAYEEGGDWAGQSASLLRLGVLKYEIGDTYRSTQCFDESVVILRNNNSDIGRLSATYGQIATTLASDGKTIDALARLIHFFSSFDLFPPTGAESQTSGTRVKIVVEVGRAILIL